MIAIHAGPVTDADFDVVERPLLNPDDIGAPAPPEKTETQRRFGQRPAVGATGWGFTCADCGRPSPQPGSGYRWIGAQSVRVCAACKVTARVEEAA